MRARRTFDEKFKRQVVESVLSGSIIQAELARKYAISPLLISRWKKEYKSGKFFENNMDITRFELRLHELERVVGELTMENRMLRQVIDMVEKGKKRRVINCNIQELQNVKKRCQIMKTPRSSFYYKPQADKVSETDFPTSALFG